MSLTRRILRLLAIIIVTPVLFLLGCQSRLIYYPRSYSDDDLSTLRRAGGRQLDYITSQGKQAAFYIPPRDAAGTEPQRIWLCFGGNGSLALHWLFIHPALDQSCGYLLIDYPGYGACEGKPNPATIKESALAATNRLRDELRLSAEEMQPRLYVLGHSIGCAAALMAADELGVQRAVLVSPFTTMTEMGREVLGWPLCHLNLHRFDNRKTLASIAAKGARVTIFHGQGDNIIPIAMSRELAASNAGAATLIEITGAGHNDILDIAEKQIAEEMR